MEKDELLGKIIAIEWEMFSSVANVGGPASCQHNPETFRIMRVSQCDAWPEAMLESYCADLEAAQAAGRNLMTEKYARMMRWTFPEEYEALAGSLPEVDDATMALIDEIVDVNLAWHDDVARRWPCLAAHGRPARRTADGGGVTSLETYLRSEMMTWSPGTVALYHRITLEKRDRGGNEAEENLLNQMLQYGFRSLDEAERKLAERAAARD